MKVKVWNDNTYHYEEVFKGNKVKISPKSFVLMDMDDAVYFRGTCPGGVIITDGVQDPKTYKMIRIEEDLADVHEKEVDPLHCLACSYIADDETDLKKHADATHAHQIAQDEEAEAFLAKKNESKRTKKAV